jgi:PAS domain S-box-containing protein
MDAPSNELQDLRRTVRDVVAVSMLPALWASLTPNQIAAGLAEVLFTALHLEFSFVSVVHETKESFQAAYTQRGFLKENDLKELSRKLGPLISADCRLTVHDSLPHPLANSSGSVQILVFALGPACKNGVLIAGAKRSSFPLETERLVLNVAINQAWVMIEQKQAQARASMAESQLRLTTDAVPAMISYIGPDLRYKSVNAEYQRWFGSPSSDVIGKSVEELLGKERFEERKAYFDAVLSGRRVDFEAITPHKTLGLRQTSHTYVPDFDRAGSVRGFVVFSVDITDQRLAENAIRESETRYMLASRATRDAIWDWNLITNEVAWNEAIHTEYGYPIETMKTNAMWWYEHIHPEDRERIVQGIHEIIDHGGNHWSDEYRFKKADESYVTVHDQGYVVHDGNTRPIRMIGAMQNITKQRNAENELRAAISIRDDFLSIASHELRTPLATLKLQVQLFQLNREKEILKIYEPAYVNKLIDQTERQASRLTRLVDDMLDISRISTGKLRIEKEPASLFLLVKEVVDRLKPSMIQAGTPPELICPEKIEGFWDKYRLEQVITNLLTNAMRYGGMKPVLVKLEKLDSSVARISVRDHGIGIAKEAQERIFDRFERAVKSDNISGLGLGLFITRQIVELHGVKIWVESELGAGSTFFIDLPLSELEKMKGRECEARA